MCEDEPLPLSTTPDHYFSSHFKETQILIVSDGSKPASCFLSYRGGSCTRLTISNVIIDFSITVNTEKTQFLLYRKYRLDINIEKLAAI